MQLKPTAMAMIHQGTKTCLDMHAAKPRREAVSNSTKALEEKSYAYGEELERVEVFKYLGRLIAFDDDDMQAIRESLKKARRHGNEVKLQVLFLPVL